MSVCFVALPGHDVMAQRLAALTGGVAQALEVHVFPDGEQLPRFPTPVAGKDIVLVAGLDHPDAKVLPLLFAADAARQMGARKVMLVAPYLCYMRQDRSFRPGEAVTSRSFAALISRAFDGLVTVDPHLHRYHALSEIYSIPAAAVPSAPLLAQWIGRNVENPFLVGPDRESRQWVEAVAALCGAPAAVMAKTRLGDREIVEVSVPVPRGMTPVLLDDIVSSGVTAAEALRALALAGTPAPVMVAVHVIGREGRQAVAASRAELITTNSIDPRGEIDLAPLLAEGLSSMARVSARTGAPAR